MRAGALRKKESANAARGCPKTTYQLPRTPAPPDSARSASPPHTDEEDRRLNRHHMLGSFALARPGARVAPLAPSPPPGSVRSSTESLHMTLAQHLDVREPDEAEVAALLTRVHDQDVPLVADDDALLSELALLEGQLKAPTSGGALANLGAARAQPERVPEEADEDGSDSPAAPPSDAPGGHAASTRPRAPALRDCARHLQTLVTTVEQENAARLKLPTARGAALVLKLEDAVDRLGQLRAASGEALDALRAELHGDAALAEVLEAAVEVARDELLSADPDVAKSLREDVDKCLKKVRRDLRRADGSLKRVKDRRARAAAVPELAPQRGSGFRERRYAAPAKKPVRTAFGYNSRDRETEDVLVIPGKNGLAVRRPEFLRDTAPPTVSRHNGFQPSTGDLAGLQL